MSKAHNTSLQDDLPPPYSDTTLPSSSSTSIQHAVGIPGLFSSHLDSLRDHIRAADTTRSSAREQLDNQTLSLLVPHIEELLSWIANLDPAPSVVETIFVPDSAIGKDWQHGDPNEREKDEIRRVVRVKQDAKLGGSSGDQKRQSSPPSRSSHLDSSLSPFAPREFSSWGRWDDGDATGSSSPDYPAAGSGSTSTLWWSDEAMAHRLAKHLQPAAKLDRATVRQNVSTVRPAPSTASSSSRSRFGGLLRRDLPIPMMPESRLEERQMERNDGGMRVRAEEVSFRRENEMGIWESRRGFAVVVRVDVRRI